MAAYSDPWAGIEGNVSEGQLRARRADSSHPWGFYWARDAKGHRLLRLAEDGLDTAKELPSVRGVAVELNEEGLTLRLLESSDAEIFCTLCLNLIERTRHLLSAGLVLDTVITHLTRWQRFLGRGNDGLLSDSEIRGLFAELVFLEMLYGRFGTDAVAFWNGPAGYPQDFAIGTTLFEVKSRLAGAPPVITISSAEQLWHDNGVLWLVCYTIGITNAGASGAVSLLGLAERIRNSLAGTASLDLFEDRLLQAGYADHPEYGKKYYTVSVPDYFAVTEGFPRLTARTVPAGLCQIRYGIELAACMPFRAEPDWFLPGGAHGA